MPKPGYSWRQSGAPLARRSWLQLCRFSGVIPSQEPGKAGIDAGPDVNACRGQGHGESAAALEGAAGPLQAGLLVAHCERRVPDTFSPATPAVVVNPRVWASGYKKVMELGHGCSDSRQAVGTSSGSWCSEMSHSPAFIPFPISTPRAGGALPAPEQFAAQELPAGRGRCGPFQSLGTQLSRPPFPPPWPGSSAADIQNPIPRTPHVRQSSTLRLASNPGEPHQREGLVGDDSPTWRDTPAHFPTEGQASPGGSRPEASNTGGSVPTTALASSANEHRHMAGSQSAPASWSRGPHGAAHERRGVASEAEEEEEKFRSELRTRMGGRRKQQLLQEQQQSGGGPPGGGPPPTVGTAQDKRNAGQLIQAILSGQLDEILGEDDGEEGEAAPEGQAVPEELQRSLRVGVVGAPNAGKSVLTNTLVGAKISAVSRKTNTTRAETKGVRTAGDTQLVLHDTPGVAYEIASRQLDRAARQATTRAMGVVDICELLLIVVDAERQIRMPDPRVWRLLQNLGSERRVGQTRAVCLNKIDLIADKQQLLPLAREISELHAIDRIFMISGMKQKGLSALEDFMFAQAVKRPWEEDPTKVTDRSGMSVALDVVREKLFERLHQELPYSVEQRHVSWKELADGSLRIEQCVFVKSDSQRSIVVGKSGKTIRQIGTAARLELEFIFRKTVHLILEVKVKLDRRR